MSYIRALTDRPGIVALVDGQFGSTGKGVIAGYLAREIGTQFNVVTSNAGPNSGHTSYLPDGRKVVLKQLPTMAVQSALLHRYMPVVYLNGGAVVAPNVLNAEIRQFVPNFASDIVVHPCAAEIDAECREEDANNVTAIASTGQGVGPALMRKLSRGARYVIGHKQEDDHYQVRDLSAAVNDRHSRVFMEVSQGFSLGINQGAFYPNVTSRECTVAQALADAGAAPQRLKDVIMAVRTYPIRVGSTENSSGGCYPDQREIEWGDIGVEPETTTVTGRQRRVFTFSVFQFMQALAANRPSILFVNFMNYLPREQQEDFLKSFIYKPYEQVMGQRPKMVLLGHGPTSEEIVEHR